MWKTLIKDLAPNAPKGILYGAPGIGKTTFAAKADNSIIIDCENGAGAVQCTRTPYLDNWTSIEVWLKQIETDQHPYKVMAIDSLDWLLRRIEEHVSGCAKDKLDQTLNKSHGGYGNGKQVLKNHIYRVLLPILDRIVNRGIAVILLAHAKRTDITDIDGVTIEKTTADISDDFLSTFVEWSDFVCLARMDIDGKRTITTSETNRALAKNRYGMPASIVFSWESFTSAIADGMEGKFEKKEKK
jgi:hypothetical protein